MKKVLFAVILLLVIASGASPAEKAIPVMQSTYNYMQFYVYKPNNLPKGYYVTFDGYIVYTAPGGVWKYASAENNAIARTNYVVGEVVPSALNIKPYNRELSSISPIITASKAEIDANIPKTTRIIYTPPASASEASLSSDWIHNANFMALGKWQKSVDRVGIISGMMIPVAWKGDFPAVIYAWTGINWRQLEPRSQYMSAESIMRREIYDLRQYMSRMNAPRWTNDDASVLAQQARVWGYEWRGFIRLERSY